MINKTDKQLINDYKRLYNQIYNLNLYSIGDLTNIGKLENLLRKRGYEIKFVKKPTLRKI